MKSGRKCVDCGWDESVSATGKKICCALNVALPSVLRPAPTPSKMTPVNGGGGWEITGDPNAFVEVEVDLTGVEAEPATPTKVVDEVSDGTPVVVTDDPPTAPMNIDTERKVRAQDLQLAGRTKTRPMPPALIDSLLRNGGES